MDDRIGHLAEMADHAQFLRETLVSRKDKGVSYLSFFEAAKSLKIAASLLAITVYSPKTVLGFFRQYESDLKAVRDYSSLASNVAPSIPE
jgi:hypothetical protein